MKVVLFCGGAGMRLRGYADDVPKPMVQVGTRPLLWHLMKYTLGTRSSSSASVTRVTPSRITFCTTMSPSPTISSGRRPGRKSTF